jgi:hypothetical protein
LPCGQRRLAPASPCDGGAWRPAQLPGGRRLCTGRACTAPFQSSTEPRWSSMRRHPLLRAPHVWGPSRAPASSGTPPPWMRCGARPLSAARQCFGSFHHVAPRQRNGISRCPGFSFMTGGRLLGDSQATANHGAELVESLRVGQQAGSCASMCVCVCVCVCVNMSFPVCVCRAATALTSPQHLTPSRPSSQSGLLGPTTSLSCTTPAPGPITPRTLHISQTTNISTSFKDDLPTIIN